MFWKTASAVPWYQLLETRCIGGRISMNSPSSLATTVPQPSRMWRFEREGLVLGQDIDVAKVRVDAVGEGDVDDAVLAGEGDGRLGAIAGEGEEPFASAAGKQNTKGISHSLSNSDFCDERLIFIARQSDAQSDSRVTRKRESNTVRLTLECREQSGGDEARFTWPEPRQVSGCLDFGALRCLSFG